MQHYEDRSSMQEPGLCFVCETAPQAGVIDTLQNFSPGFPSSLSGRKYVCDGCAAAVAETAGFFATGDVVTANARADEAEARYNAVRAHVASATAAFSDAALVSAGDASPAVVSAAVVVEAPVEAEVADDEPEADVPA